LWIRVFPFVPVTKKSIASRMGKGKGIYLIEWHLLKQAKFYLKLIIHYLIKHI
jgi:ribosomal protein L16/L10AE